MEGRIYCCIACFYPFISVSVCYQSIVSNVVSKRTHVVGRRRGEARRTGCGTLRVSRPCELRNTDSRTETNSPDAVCYASLLHRQTVPPPRPQTHGLATCYLPWHTDRLLRRQSRTLLQFERQQRTVFYDRKPQITTKSGRVCYADLYNVLQRNTSCALRPDNATSLSRSKSRDHRTLYKVQEPFLVELLVKKLELMNTVSQKVVRQAISITLSILNGF